MKLPVVLISEDNLALVSLRQHLEKERDFLVDGKVRSFEEAFGFLRVKIKSGPILVIVDLSRDAERAFRVAEELKLKLPNIHLVMTSPDSHPQTILRAMRSGAQEFLTQPFNWVEVLQSLEAIRGKIQVQASRGVEQGRIITVFSNKGGVGSTTVATNLAVTLAAQRKSVCIMDLVLQFGSVATFLNLEPSYTILDLVKNLKRIDPMLLDGSLVKHGSGVRVLAEPFHAEDASAVMASDVEQILDTLVQSFEIVIVDMPKDFDETVGVALDKSYLVLFVTEMDVPSLKSAHRALELFERMGVYQRKVRLVLNRFVKSKIMSLESVEKTLGVKVFWTLPNDYPTAIAALNQGLSIQETDGKSELARSYQGLAEGVMKVLMGGGRVQAEEEGSKLGIFGRWLQRRGVAEETPTPTLGVPTHPSNAISREQSLGEKAPVPGKSTQGFTGGTMESRSVGASRKAEGDGNRAEPLNFQRGGFVELTAATKSRSDSVPPRFFEYVTRALTEAMGPMASLVVRDQVAALGESMDAFPKRRLKELLEMVSREILDEKLKVRFRDQMTEEIRTLKSA